MAGDFQDGITSIQKGVPGPQINAVEPIWVTAGVANQPASCGGLQRGEAAPGMFFPGEHELNRSVAQTACAIV